MKNTKYPQQGILRTMQSDYAIATGQAQDSLGLSKIVYRFYDSKKGAGNILDSMKKPLASEKPASASTQPKPLAVPEKPSKKSATPKAPAAPKTKVIINTIGKGQSGVSVQKGDVANQDTKKADKSAGFSVGGGVKKKVIQNPEIVVKKAPAVFMSPQNIPDKLPVAEKVPEIFSKKTESKAIQNNTKPVNNKDNLNKPNSINKKVDSKQDKPSVPVQKSPAPVAKKPNISAPPLQSKDKGKKDILDKKENTPKPAIPTIKPKPVKPIADKKPETDVVEINLSEEELDKILPISSSNKKAQDSSEGSLQKPKISTEKNPSLQEDISSMGVLGSGAEPNVEPEPELKLPDINMEEEDKGKVKPIDPPISAIPKKQNIANTPIQQQSNPVVPKITLPVAPTQNTMPTFIPPSQKEPAIQNSTDNTDALSALSGKLPPNQNNSPVEQQPRTPLQHAQEIEKTQPQKRMMDDILAPSTMQSNNNAVRGVGGVPSNLPTQSQGVGTAVLPKPTMQKAPPISQTINQIPTTAPPIEQFDLQSTITTPEQILGLQEPQEMPGMDGGGDKGYFDELSDAEADNKKTYMMMGAVVLLIVVSFIVVYMLLSGGDSEPQVVSNTPSNTGNNLPPNNNVAIPPASNLNGDNTAQPTQNNTALNSQIEPEPTRGIELPQQTEPDVINAKTPPSPLVRIQGMLTRPYPINNPNLSEIKGVFDSIKAQEFPPGSITYIPIELTNKTNNNDLDQFISARLFIDALGIDAPDQFLDSIEPTFMLYAYSPTEDDRAECERASLRSSTCPGVRLGLVFEQRASPGINAVSLPNLVSNWIESSNITTMKPLILDNVIFPDKVQFKNTVYGELDHPISYVNLPHPSTAIDFATIGRYLVIGTSKNSVLSMIKAINNSQQ